MAALRDSPGAGLCDSCRHCQRVRNHRGSVFHLCQRALSDARFTRYPRIPVRECPGHEELDRETDAKSD